MCHMIYKNQYCDRCKRQPTGILKFSEHCVEHLWRYFTAYRIKEWVPCEDLHCTYRKTGNWGVEQTDKVNFIHHAACLCRRAPERVAHLKYRGYSDEQQNTSDAKDTKDSWLSHKSQLRNRDRRSFSSSLSSVSAFEIWNVSFNSRLLPWNGDW